MLLMPLAVLTIGCAAAVAWANGANDVSKGVATLVGSRLATYAQALRWGTACTVAGAVSALMLTTTMVTTFSTGLVGSVSLSPVFPLAVASGAFVWVLIASKTGLPVSTTHSLTGAIVGAALAAGGVDGIQWALVLKSVAVPLALSPLVAAVIAYGLHAALSRRLTLASRYCICTRARPLLMPEPQPGAAATPRPVMMSLVVVDEERVCAAGGTLEAGLRLTDAAHWMTSAALSFARGLNDAPKIVALGVAAAGRIGLDAPSLFIVGAVVMGAGSLISGRTVTRTLAERIAHIDPLEGLAASAVAAVLVLAASVVALPVSTTQVVCGAIVGAGLRSGSRRLQWTTLRSIVGAWLITVPASGVAAALVSTVIFR